MRFSQASLHQVRGCLLPATWPNNCAFLARLSWRHTTNCWPKVSLLAAVVQEHMLQRDCLLVDSLGARSLQSFGYRVLEALLPMLLSLWRARDDNLITGTTSSSDGARVTSRLFPFAQWHRMLTRRARKASVAELDYGPPAGDPALREAICAHLRRSRAVACDPSEVIIVNGSQQALDLIARVLLERGDRVAIENPSYQGTRQILLAAGARLIPVPVDTDGLNPAKLPKNARLCFVTPSHQFPTGAILSLARRLALLEWTNRTNAVVVEDDYDGEFHYRGQPLESLQGLDTDGRIIYVGTFSRTVFPSLRVGYLVVPKFAHRSFHRSKVDQRSALRRSRTGGSRRIHRHRGV